MSKPAKIFLFLVLFTGFFGAGKSNGKTVFFAYQQGPGIMINLDDVIEELDSLADIDIDTTVTNDPDDYLEDLEIIYDLDPVIVNDSIAEDLEEIQDDLEELAGTDGLTEEQQQAIEDLLEQIDNLLNGDNIQMCNNTSKMKLKFKNRYYTNNDVFYSPKDTLFHLAFTLTDSTDQVIPFDSIEWVNAIANEDSTIDVINNNGRTEIAAKYNSDCIKLKIRKIYFSFSKCPETGTYYNRYGYDNVNSSDITKHHLSIASGESTFLNFETNNSKKIDFVQNNSILSVDTVNLLSVSVLKIDAFPNIFKDSTKLFFICKDTGDTITSININVYDEVKFDENENENNKLNIFNIYDSSFESPENLTETEKQNIINDANLILKQSCVNIINPSINQADITYDKNGNHTLELFNNYYQNSWYNYEIRAIYDSFVGKNYKNIMITNGVNVVLGFFNSYSADISIPYQERKKIKIAKMLGHPIGWVYSEGYNIGETYTIQSPDGSNSENFVIEDIKIIQDTFCIILTDTLKFDHPAYIDHNLSHLSHYIIPQNPPNVAALSGRYTEGEDYSTYGSLFFGKFNFNGQAIAHETLHLLGLNHVTPVTNVMYYMLGNNELLYRLLEIDKEHIPDPEQIPRDYESQWNQINRNINSD